ncbi:hypothetical protein ACI2IX_18425 [Leifsonia aquatica]|uniref:hypothetical protein n=1 Tax=Leifsonia aquatica TaxID=144185 RepID=UPI00384EEA2C
MDADPTPAQLRRDPVDDVLVVADPSHLSRTERNPYWREFWISAVVAAPAGVISGVVQVSRDTPPVDAILGGSIVFLAVTLITPLIRHAVLRRSR